MEVAGEVRNNTWGPGAHAITAGRDDEPVYSVTGSKGGSIFFETLIRGISLGDADVDSRQYPLIKGSDGNLQQRGGGVVRLGALDAWLSLQIDRKNDRTGGNPVTHMPYAYPVVGSVEPATKPAKRAFFFLQPQYIAPGTSVAIQVPDGPLSSVPGHPELKVFKTPSSYPTRGIEVSQYNIGINWRDIKNDNIQFVYILATLRDSNRNIIDENFLKNWIDTKEAGLKRGAYHAYSYCLSPKEQFDFITQIVPKDEDALPISVDAQYVLPEFAPEGKSCFDALGSSGISKNLDIILGMLQEYYGKRPILYGPQGLLKQWLPQESYLKFPIWVDTSSISSMIHGPKLPGTNPWTLWHYSEHEKVKGITGSVNMNVFFGTAAQFEEFSQGQRNVALEAAMSVDIGDHHFNPPE